MADDDPEDQELLLNAFQQITDEYTLTTVNSGKELVELLSHIEDNNLPCLIVLDYDMPGMDGKETLKQLQKNQRYRVIPKVIYSSSMHEKERAECISFGAKDYVGKANSRQEINESALRMLGYCRNFLMPAF